MKKDELMKKTAGMIADLYTGIFISPLRILGKRGKRFALEKICEKIESPDEYISCRIMPQVRCISGYDIAAGDTRNNICIVLQGPIVDGVTYENIMYYKRTFKDAAIVLSTWDDEDPDKISPIRKGGTIVVQSKKPQNCGVMNVNYQVVSSRAGIEKAKEMGVEFVAKTRSDQCIRKQNVFQFLAELLKEYPANTNRIDSRIVVMPTYFRNMFTPYHVSDFFYFVKRRTLKSSSRLILMRGRRMPCPSVPQGGNIPGNSIRLKYIY